VGSFFEDNLQEVMLPTLPLEGLMMNGLVLRLIGLLFCVAAFGCGPVAKVESVKSSKLKEAWNPANNPLIFDNGFEVVFGRLPLAGSSQFVPWSDTYWPDYKGGIANRWAGNGQAPWGQSAPSFQELTMMSEQQLAALSPSEKYDVLIGRYDFPTTTAELTRTNPNAPRWAGLCHGWAAASTLFREPKPIKMMNMHGIQIPFGSADIKALLTYHEAVVSNPWTRQRVVGQRCNQPGTDNSPDCRDVNAGSFHVSLGNFLGINRMPFIADITRSAEVWNQPVVDYTTQVLQQRSFPSFGAAYGTVQEVDVRTTIRYVSELEAQWQPTGANLASETYDYRLELDAFGRILGGEWYGTERLDFLWNTTAPVQFEMPMLDQLYRASM
jgi:hypothetical protein